MKLIKTRRQHFSERGMPLRLTTFRAFLQLSFLYEPSRKDSALLLLNLISIQLHIFTDVINQFESYFRLITYKTFNLTCLNHNLV